MSLSLRRAHDDAPNALLYASQSLLFHRTARKRTKYSRRNNRPRQQRNKRTNKRRAGVSTSAMSLALRGRHWSPTSVRVVPDATHSAQSLERPHRRTHHPPSTATATCNATRPDYYRPRLQLGHWRPSPHLHCHRCPHRDGRMDADAGQV